MAKHSYILPLFVFAFVFLGCKKQKESQDVLVTIESINSVFQGKVDYQAHYYNIDVDNIDKVGLCWSNTDDAPNLADEYEKTSFSSNSQDFGEEVNGFESGTKYYFRAFVQHDDGFTYYSEVVGVDLQPGWTSAGSPNSDNPMGQSYFVNPTTGYLSSSYPGGYGLLYKTTNGGESWITLESLDAILTDDLMFVSEDKGYRVCHSGSDNMLQRTENGGSSWSTLSYGEDVNIVALSNVDPNTIFIATSNNYIKKSTNSGGFWTNSVLLELHELDRIRDLAFLDSSTGFAVTKLGNVYKTTNGGASWSVICPLVALETKQICVVNASTSFIMSEKSVYKTSDGGYTWNLKHEITNSHEFNFSIDFANDQFGALGGFKSWTSPSDGYIFMTRDGGETWDEKWDLSFAPREIQLLSTEIGFGVGYHLYRYQ